MQYFVEIQYKKPSSQMTQKNMLNRKDTAFKWKMK